MRICFVCQSGKLEAQAVLLAASLRIHFPPDTDLIAAHPGLKGALRPATRRALAALDVNILPVANPLRNSYPIGHKLAALMLLGGPKPGLLLDTDTLAMSAPELLPEDALAAVPATDNHYGLPVWRRAYQRFGLSVPASAPATLRSGHRIAPYFNSGMIAVPGRIAGWLAATWIETSKSLDSDWKIPKRKFLDQLSLPIAAQRLGHRIEAIDRRWNFAAWAFNLETGALPIIFHYRELKQLHKDDASLRAARRAAELLPSVRDALDAGAFTV